MGKRSFGPGVFFLFVFGGVLVIGALDASLLREHTRKANQAWLEFETQCDSRRNLLPNFANAVKYYVKGEEAVGKKLMKIRDEALTARVAVTELSDENALEKFRGVQSEIGGLLSQVNGVVLRHPKLAANDSFRDLILQLHRVEDLIMEKNRTYVFETSRYNHLITRFPSRLIARYVLRLKARTIVKWESNTISLPSEIASGKFSSGSGLSLAREKPMTPVPGKFKYDRIKDRRSKY